MIMRLLLALAAFGMVASPVAAQIDPAARGLAVQAKAAASQAQTLALGRDPLLVTAIGDSRIDAITIDAARNAKNMRSELVWASELTGQRFVIGPTFGKSGDRTDQVLTRMPLVLGTNAGTLYWKAAVNDIAQNYPTAATSGATAAANTIIGAEMARLAGMKVIIALEVGATGLTAAQYQQVQEYNIRMIDYQENAVGVYLSDARSAVMNPTASTTTSAFKTSFSLDGTHSVSRGAFYDAQAGLVPLFNNLLPPRSVFVRSAAELPTNGRWQLLLNPIFATATGGAIDTKAALATLDGTTGVTLASTNANPLATMPIGATITGTGIPAGATITAQPNGGGAGKYTISQAATATASGVAVTISSVQGTIPSGWTWGTTGQALATVSTQADPDGIGNNVIVTCTWVNAGDGCRLFQTVGTAFWSQGDLLQSVSQVQVTSASQCLAATRLNMLVNGTIGTNTSTEVQDGYHATTAGSLGPDQPYTATLLTRPFAVPAFTTKGYLAAYVYLEGACAGSVTAVIKQVGIRRRLSSPNG
jgi:hypothetical protein